MSNENKPPQSLKDILSEVNEDMRQRTVERKRNFRANEVYLQAEGLLQPKKMATLKKIGKFLLSDENPKKYRSLPPVPFEFEGKKIKVQLKDHVNLGEDHRYKNGISIVISIGSVAPEELELFHLKKEGEHWNPILKMGNRYSVLNRYRKEAAPEEVEVAAEILNFIQKTPKPLPKSQ